jgi:acylphosphatase
MMKQVTDKLFHAIVHGRVQGVSFRYHTRAAASTLGLCGWVKNLPNGTVEVLAQGDEGDLRDLLRWLENGPPASRVDKLDIDWRDPANSTESFEIIY